MIISKQDIIQQDGTGKMIRAKQWQVVYIFTISPVLNTPNPEN